MGKFDEIAAKLSVLDRPEKLKILALLAEEGQRSISAVSKELKIHFSTTHKYLEQLEKAGFVRSKNAKEDRLKRYFFINDFDVRVSPDSLSGVKQSEKVEKTFKLLTDEGEEGYFDKKKFIQQYSEAGVPKIIIDLSTEYMLRHVYDGITILELRNLFKCAMRDLTKLIQDSTEKIEQQNIRKRTYVSLLNYLHPELITKHLEGDIFIQNLWKPRLFNFVHDIRGISQHGIDGTIAKTMKDLLYQLAKSIELAEGLGAKSHCLDSINYFLAPFWEGDRKDLENFLMSLKTEVYIGIDLGEPKFARNIPVTFWGSGERKPGYQEYNNTAWTIANEIINILQSKKTNNLKLVCKVWSKDYFDKLPERGIYVANMYSEWQGENASYIGENARFDSGWRGWMASVRAGEVERIVLNLPRLAKRAKSINDFLEKLKSLLTEVIQAYAIIAELTHGAFFDGVWRKSSITSRWKYVVVEHLQYALSIFGLNEVIEILSKKSLSENIDLGKQIMDVCLNTVEEGCGPLRIVLAEENSPRIIQRFINLDKVDVGIKNYSPGVSCDNFEVSALLHPYLKGGHCIRSDKNSLKLLKDFGLAIL